MLSLLSLARNDGDFYFRFSPFPRVSDADNVDCGGHLGVTPLSSPDWSIKIWQRRPGARLGPGVTWDMGWWGLTCHDGRMVWPGASVISVITNMMRCDQHWGVICDIRDSWSVIDDAWHWSVFPSCLKWSASDALINLFSFGWFCLISNGGSLHWEHTVIRIKLDLLTFYTWYVHQHSIYHRLRVSKHQFITCY